MAPNSIILSVLFLLLLSISPSLESEDVMTLAKNNLKAFGYSTDNDTYDDPDGPSTDNITLHYAFYPGSPKWPKSKMKLKYTFITNKPYPSRNVTSAIWNAFSTWSAVTGFTFKEAVGASSSAHIKIGFYSGAHGDSFPFDGRGGEFAHSSPPTSGIIHFDVDEEWGTVQAPNILDIQSVALHEIGHALGLAHSDSPSAVMYATFDYGEIKRELDRDDIDGIRALYDD